MTVIGETRPPDYRDPVRMLRNLADDIEAGVFGDVGCVAVAALGSAGLEVFGGGRDSTRAMVALSLQAGANRLTNALVGV